MMSFASALLCASFGLVVYLSLRGKMVRLQRLHGALILGVSELRATVSRRRATMAELAPLASASLPGLGAPIDALARCQRAVDEAAAALQRKPTDVAALTEWREAELALDRRLPELSSEISNAPGFRPGGRLDRLLDQVALLGERLRCQGRSFDALGELYNDRRSQFPGRALASLLGMAQAVPLALGAESFRHRTR